MSIELKNLCTNSNLIIQSQSRREGCVRCAERVSATSMDRREIDGHVSRAEERRVLADLSGFPNLAAMLVVDEIRKKNRKKNSRRKNKKKPKIECQPQNDTEQHHQKPAQMQVTGGPKLHELVILLDESDGDVTIKSQSCKMGSEETMPLIEAKRMRESGQEEEGRGNNVGVGIVSQKVSNGHISKVDEYQMLADLTDFPNLASMLAFEAKNIKKKKNKKRKIEIGVQNDVEQHHQKPGQMQVTERANLQELVILSDDSDGEVMTKSHSCKMDDKETVQSIEVKRMQESSKEEEERRNNVGVGIANHKVSNSHISKVDEYQKLADLTDFPNLASMLAFEATWRKNRKKKKKKNKTRKIEIRAQNDTEQHCQKPEPLAATEAPKLQELVTLPDSNDNGGIKNGQSYEINGEDATELREGKKKQNNNNEEEEKGENAGVQSGDHKASNGYISKADEYKMLMDLTDFPNLAALLAFEAARRKNRKKKKNKKSKNEFQLPNNMADVAKEETHTNTCKAVETTKAFKVDDNVSSAVIADLYISKSQEHTVNTVEEDKRADSSKERMPFQPKSIKNLDEIVPIKLLCHPRHFDHPESSRVMAEDDHTAVNHTMQKQKKPCFVCGGLKRNATHCKQAICCSVCCGRGHPANECPEKHESSKICLRCGDSGHDLFSCGSDYSYDDLKEIQCFVCKAFGHLCCVDYMV